MGSEKINAELKNKYDKVLNKDLEPVELGNLLKDIANTGRSVSVGYRGVLDVVFIRENLKINRSMKNLTWTITGLTVVNVFLVAVTTYFIIFN